MKNPRPVILYLIVITVFILNCGNSDSKKPPGSPEDIVYGYGGPDSPVYFKTYYVRPGAAGSGADWGNALPAIPSSLERGAVYYLADGVYGYLSLNAPEEGILYTGIKKAVAGDHGTDTGWDPTYGDGTADFQRIDVNNSYMEIDGQTGGGPGSWTAGNGIHIIGDWAVDETSERLVYMKQFTSNIIISHVELNPLVVHQGIGHSFYGLDVSNIKIDHCYAHDNFGVFVFLRRAKNLLIEYNYFYNNLSTPVSHAEFMSETGSDNLTLRYNFFKYIDGTGVFAGVNGDPADPSENWEIYGNIVTESTHFIYYYYGVNDFNRAVNWRIYNNTLKNTVSADKNGRVWFENGTNIEIVNNLWYNYVETENYLVIYKENTDYNSFYDCDFRLGAPEGEHNEFLTGDPFSDSGFDDFSLAANSPSPGYVFEAPYNWDMLGNLRGEDGNWDRGALER